MPGIVTLVDHRGLRVGYMAQGGNRAFLFGGPSEGVLLKPPEKAIEFHFLPLARDTDGECSRCGKYPNPSKEVWTDVGLQRVVECTACNNLMRPRI